MFSNRFQRISKTVVVSGHRYWRILATNLTWDVVAGNYYQGIYTISFFTSTDGSGTDLCVAGTPDASTTFTSPGYEASKASDGNDATYWATQTGVAVPQWWRTDLGSSHAIHSVKLLSFNAYVLLSKSYALQWSDDNSTWTTQATFSPTNSTSPQTFTGL